MKVHSKTLKAFGVLLVAALLFGAMPVGKAMAQTTVEIDLGGNLAALLGADAISTDSFQGDGSWSSNGNLMEFYIDPTAQPMNLSGVTVDDVDNVVYRTKDGSASGVDWGFYIYTVGTKYSWYEERLVSEPLYSNNYDGAPADTWNTWNTASGTNQLVFYDDHYTSIGFYNGPTLADIQAGPIDWSDYGYAATNIDYGAQEILYFKFGTGSAWSSTFFGLLDAIEITVSGTTYVYDLEEFVPVTYVDDSWAGTTIGADPDGTGPAKIFGNDAFATIQEAIAATAPGGTVNVAAGTYVEVGQIVIDKDLTIIGEDKATTIIKPAQDTGSSGDARGWFFVPSGVEFNLSNVTLDGQGYQIFQAIRFFGTGTINNNVFINITHGDYNGTAVGTAGDITFSNNTLSNINRVGFLAIGSTVTVTGNTYTGKGDGDWLDYGIEINGATATITGNTITNIGESTTAWDSAGISIYTTSTTPANATLANNTLSGNDKAIAIGYATDDLSVVTASNNIFSNNQMHVDAENATNHNIANTLANNTFDKMATIDGDVDIFGTIQGAIDDAAASDTIQVGPGTYTEALSITKDLTLQGAGAGVSIIQSPDTLPLCFTSSADNYAIVCIENAVVTLDGFTVDGLGKGNANYRFLGVAFHNAGGTLQNSEVLDIRDTPFSGAQHGTAIYSYNEDDTSYTINLLNNEISGFQKNAVALNANDTTPLTINVSGNTITGAGPTDVTAQNGIQVWGKLATGVVSNNTISGIYYINPDPLGNGGSGWTATSILNYLSADLEISGNTITGGQHGILSYGTDCDILNNDITVLRQESHFYSEGIFAGNYTDTAGVLNIQDNIVKVIDTAVEPVDFDTYGIDVVAGDSNLAVTIDGNTVTDFGVGISLYEYPGDEGVLTSMNVTWNIVSGSTIGVWPDSLTNSPVIEYNQLTDNPDALQNDSGHDLLDASPNWWGSMYGPLAGQISGGNTTEFVKWCGDPGCTFFLPDDNNVIELSGNINVPGGIEVNAPGLTIFIKQGTVIKNDSPCFIINADNTTILGEYPGEEFCIPTGSSAGIEVAAGVSDLVIKNLDFDGSQTTGPAIDFAGDVDGVQIVNNRFHDFGTSAIVFGGQVLTEHVIQGNMFTDVGAPAIDSPTTALDATYNSWGTNAAPTIANVTTSPFTHVNLWVESSGALSGDQVAKGTSVTYTVFADMTEITGAEFTLAYPTSLLTLTGTTVGDGVFVGLPDGTGGTKALLDTTTTPGEIKFAGIVPLGNGPVTETDIVLFTATFTAADPIPDPNDGVMDLVEVIQGFSMVPDMEHYTNHVFPAELLDGAVTVIELPTITSADIQGYYLVGETQEFNVSVANPTEPNNGGSYDTVLFKFEVTADDGDIALFEYYDEATMTWKTMPLDCTTTPGTCVGYYGPSTGFPMAAGYADETTFQIQFAVDDDYPVTITLEDLDAGNVVLADYNNTAIAYTKPVITSADIVGPYTALVPQTFTLNINNVDPDMIEDGLVVTQLSFSFPEGTVVTYGGVDYTCTSTGCPLIPVTLVAGSNALDFTVEFPTGYVGDVSATLLDTDWDPDRELATNTWTVTVYNNWAVEGKVTMQGRTYRGDVPMMLTSTQTGFVFGPYTEYSLNQMGVNIFFTDIAESEYTITTNQDRYLNVPGSMFLINADTVLPDLYLYGGNANNDTEIGIGDASVVGGAYNNTGDPLTLVGDVNFDGVVNIQDLAIVGGNYGIDDTVYATWN